MPRALPMSQQTAVRKLDLIFYYREEEEEGGIANMDWINCNLCCRQPGDERERTFTLSSCGHIFCDLCLARVESREKCAVCSSVCQMMQLSSKMKPDAEMFFQEPTTLIKKHFTLITRLLDFQKDHRVRLVSFHRKIVQKYKELEKQTAVNKSQEAEKYNAAKARIQELEREVQRLRGIIASDRGAGSTGNPGKTSSPRVSPGGTIISPGRITMVKNNQGLPGASRGIPNISPTASYAQHPSSTPSRGKTFSPVSCQYLVPQHQQHQQPRHTEGIQQPMPGISYFRNISPVIPRKSSPTSRIMPGPPSLLSMSGSHGHSSTPGFHPFMRPPQPQPRPHTPVNYPSPDPYGRQPHDLAAYKKFSM
ncbi:RING finger protein 212B-like isoform X1 [Eriocheir sinensis]|uniref:RING finger protein 212B-like isoform X1 n=2 Tax=Eriocheir sinensis TaxID=95602 RepID=UPI0021C6CCF7|nr:RING finger protein 212B-like isoform X1 [Eriocheir sinensis]